MNCGIHSEFVGPVVSDLMCQHELFSYKTEVIIWSSYRVRKEANLDGLFKELEKLTVFLSSLTRWNPSFISNSGKGFQLTRIHILSHPLPARFRSIPISPLSLFLFQVHFVGRVRVRLPWQKKKQ